MYMNHFKHIKKSFKSISRNQWIGLVIAIIGSTLAWVKLVFIVNPAKNNKIKITRFQYYALFIGWVITSFGWMKLLALVDPLNNTVNTKCNCKCN